MFQYYEDTKRYFSSDEWVPLSIAAPMDVWRHVQFGGEAIVSRRSHGDRRVYISLECNCDWEQEHGLQLVLRDGREITKVGPYDGQLTNADAYGRNDYEGVVYVRV